MSQSESISDPDFYTLIGSIWVDPIADLASSWLNRTRRQCDLHHMTPADYGSCYSIILLLVVMLESYTVRILIEEQKIGVRKPPPKVFEWWAEQNYEAKEEVLDIFVIRDAIVHNHVYGYSFDNERDKIETRNPLLGGDKKFGSSGNSGG
jgi:hypothetical protein